MRDITLVQGWNEKVFDIGQETRSIHRPIEHAGRSDLIVAKRSNECHCHPVAIRHGCNEALTAGRAAIKPHHVGLRPSFINEDKTFRVQIGLACTPFAARFGNVCVVLFGGA
jgi:hypothetical protein